MSWNLFSQQGKTSLSLDRYENSVYNKNLFPACNRCGLAFSRRPLLLITVKEKLNNSNHNAEKSYFQFVITCQLFLRDIMFSKVNWIKILALITL